MKAKLKAAEQWVRLELLRKEVALKSAAAAAVAGGINAVYNIYKNGGHFELTAAHLLELKSVFISGAFIGVIAYLVKSPLGRQAQQQQQSNASSTT
jgi:hypothetical protein